MNTMPVEIFFKQADTSKLQVATVYILNGLGFLSIDQQFAILEFIAERDKSAHPHPLFLGSGNFIPDTFAGNLPFKLCEGE